MPHDGQDIAVPADILLPDLTSLTAAAIGPVETVFDTARDSLRAMVTKDGKVSAALIEANQAAAHGLSWLATYAESLRQMQKWAEKLTADGRFHETEALIHQIAFGEYLAQIAGGIPMSQGEIVRLSDIGASAAPLDTTAVQTLIASGNTQAARTRLVELMQEHAANISVGATGLDDELEMIREQFRRYVIDKVEPHAHDWHLNDELIPMEVIEELAEMEIPEAVEQPAAEPAAAAESGQGPLHHRASGQRQELLGPAHPSPGPGGHDHEHEHHGEKRQDRACAILGERAHPRDFRVELPASHLTHSSGAVIRRPFAMRMREDKLWTG